MGLHRRYARLLEDVPEVFVAGHKERDNKIRKKLSVLFDGMMKSLFKEKGAEFRVEIVADPAVQDFIDTHTSVLDSAFEKVEMSDAMRRRLTRSNYIFSGVKAFHELHEAFPSLLDENGNKKSFEQFLNDVRSIDSTYNVNYLRAEYNFVCASAEMAARWEQFMRDGDRYNLQYRTQRDDKVRPEHAALDRVTLPITDSFWEEFYPPNGWNCFVGSTPILTVAGWKFIKDIKSGDLVVGGSGKYRTVIAVHSREVDTELVRISTKGAFATCTENHRLLTSRGWITAGMLKPCDILVQVGEISTLGKFVNAIYNAAALGKYLLVSLKRKWKSVSSPTINYDVEGRNKEISYIDAKQLALLEWQSHCRQVEADCGFGFTLGLADGTHPFGMLSARFKRIGQSLPLGFRAKKRRGRSEFLRNASYKRTVRLILALPNMLAGLCKRVIGRGKSGGSLFTPQAVISPLAYYRVTSMPDSDTIVDKDAAHSPLVDAPMESQPPETALLSKIARFGGVNNLATLDRFNSVYDFLRRTFVHTRYALVDYKGTTKKSKTVVYNLSVDRDESYVVPTGIAHNCRCNVVQVRKSKYPVTPHDEAMRLGDEALQRDTKGIFRFNAGKEGKSVPDYNPYTIRRCSTCPIAKGGKSEKLARFVPDNEVCKACALLHQIQKCYTEIPVKNGKVRIHPDHGIKEAEENISIAKYLAEKYGYRIDLLPNPNNEKSADSLNHTLGYKQEYKVNSNPTKGAIDNALRKAALQANHVVLRIDSSIDLIDLTRGVKGRVKQSEIQGIIIIFKGKDLFLTRDAILSNGFQIQLEDFK